MPFERRSGNVGDLLGISSTHRTSKLSGTSMKSTPSWIEIVSSLVTKKTITIKVIHSLLKSWCLKIREKASFNIASGVSYVYILSGQKFIKNAKNGPFCRVFENLKLAVKQCYQTGHFNKDKNCDFLSNFQTNWSCAKLEFWYFFGRKKFVKWKLASRLQTNFHEIFRHIRLLVFLLISRLKLVGTPVI